MEWLIRYGGRAENVPGYDCSSSDRRSGTTNFVIGTVFIISGLVAEIIYALDMTVMVQKKYRSLPSYKIMIALGMWL
ncbi:hypothetical protein Y032_0004g1847 [Ancylostoma ceylanicum]|uniref:Uncharacterized protein n=1 Tax=Ancylostoma ceylanicum TaxID=53326 RepID=A0A016VUB3_9BILA|nr:hypothetical protein Y032_0004g1847 [Ancylostoma ceylanicum]